MILGFHEILNKKSFKSVLWKKSDCIIVKLPNLSYRCLKIIKWTNQISKIKLYNKPLLLLFFNVKVNSNVKMYVCMITTYWLEQRVLSSEMSACRDRSRLHVFFKTFKTWYVIICKNVLLVKTGNCYW
jgi:hypothetical protein